MNLEELEKLLSDAIKTIAEKLNAKDAKATMNTIAGLAGVHHSTVGKNLTIDGGFTSNFILIYFAAQALEIPLSKLLPPELIYNNEGLSSDAKNSGEEYLTLLREYRKLLEDFAALSKKHITLLERSKNNED